MGTKSDEDSPLTGALKTLGAIAGLVLGGGAGSEDPEIGFWVGAVIGALIGMAGGWFVGKTLEAVFQLAFIALALAIVGLRVYSLFNAVAA